MKTMMAVKINSRGAVDCRAVLDLHLGAASVWGQLRDFSRYAQQDFFHADVVVEGGIPHAGAKLTLSHRYGGFHVRRVGRILVWRENSGYSYSDLSQRGPARGFPHVFSYRLQLTGENSTRLEIRVRGKWTARLIPRWAAKAVAVVGIRPCGPRGGKPVVGVSNLAQGKPFRA
jgi:hypothetical protein